MYKIDTLETWQEYLRYSNAYRNGSINEHNRNVVPSYILELIEIENPLTVADIDPVILRERFLISARKMVNPFIVDKSNSAVIDLFVQYIRKDEQFLKIDPSYSFYKGLFLRGGVGTGKTLLFKALHDLMADLRFFSSFKYQTKESPRDIFRIITSNDIVKRFSLDGYLIFHESHVDRKVDYKDLVRSSLFIDDIGSEPEAVYFGARANCIAEVLLQRYENKSLTHATSNLGIDALEKVYGLRVFDRMREMFNDITLTGASRRK